MKRNSSLERLAESDGSLAETAQDFLRHGAALDAWHAKLRSARTPLEKQRVFDAGIDELNSLHGPSFTGHQVR